MKFDTDVIINTYNFFYLIYFKTMNNSNNTSFYSVNSAIQKVALYETKTVIKLKCAILLNVTEISFIIFLF